MMNKADLTPSQTVGPFFHPCMLRDDASRNVLAEPGIEGQRIRIEGYVYDGEGTPVPDAVVEIWQANGHGRYNHPADQQDLPLDLAFTGFGRSGTDDAGGYWFETIKPGRVPFDNETSQAPHICVTVFARGLLNQVVTRLYFEDDPANVGDPILQRVSEQRRGTLLAKRRDLDGSTTYRFDIVLQGAGETVFFNV